jgi:hypothetical protein
MILKKKKKKDDIDSVSGSVPDNDLSTAFNIFDVYDIEHFVAREVELLDIHNHLTCKSNRRIVVLHGLGGVGKTQLAIAYAKRHRKSYSSFFWVHTKDDDTLRQSFLEIAKQILVEHPKAAYLGGVDTMDLDEIVEAVKKWLSLSENKHWLIIYDNYDNPKLPNSRDPTAVDIRDYPPGSLLEALIVASRSPREDIGHALPVRKLDNIQDSLNILTSTSQIWDLGEGRLRLSGVSAINCIANYYPRYKRFSACRNLGWTAVGARNC